MENDTKLLRLVDAELIRGQKVLWSKLSLSVERGEFIAVLGSNGAGKTSLLNVLLGLLPLTKGSINISGEAPGSGNTNIGYIPQQKSFDPFLPIRGYDIVKLGLNGHKYGLSSTSKDDIAHLNKVIESVGASSFVKKPIGQLSGGEQQRLRIAQALVGRPTLLLCDEPLLSLDLASQSNITELISEYRHKQNAAVIFVTHDINPILPWVDRVLYIAKGKWVIDSPKVVLQSAVLSELYGSSIEVIKVKNKIFVMGDDETEAHHGAHL